MTTMTIAPATTGDDDSHSTGYTDGELAAITGLSEDRAWARAEMAAPHDPAYAAAYWDGYTTASILTAALDGNAA